MKGFDQMLYERHAEGGANHQKIPAPRAGGRRGKAGQQAIDTPDIATSTPVVFRAVSGSLPSAAPTTIVSSGNVDNASAPRAAVGEDQRRVEQNGNTAKNNRPRRCDRWPSCRGGH